MTARPMCGESGVDDPTEILRVLPCRYREQFRAEYVTAGEQARDPEGYLGLAELLRLWRLRAAAYNDPGYLGRLAAARAGGTAEDVPAEEVIAGWSY